MRRSGAFWMDSGGHSGPVFRMRIWLHFIVVAVSLVFAGCQPRATDADRSSTEKIVATYSIVAFDPATGDLGVAVQSKFFGVGTVVPWAKSGVGAIATQASVNVTYGPKGLKLLEEGSDAEQVVKLLTDADEGRDARQCGIVDAQGRSATFTGNACLAFAGGRTGKNFTVQGNILASVKVIDAMAEAYEAAQKTEGSELADWLVAALQAGEDAGGDSRGRQSAALLVVRDKGGYGGASDRYIDLRVEDHPDPTKELARLLELHKGFYRSLHQRRPKRGQ
jgi:uncharacterized Ntn-hydrolase superfamily protein